MHEIMAMNALRGEMSSEILDPEETVLGFVITAHRT